MGKVDQVEVRISKNVQQFRKYWILFTFSTKNIQYSGDQMVHKRIFDVSHQKIFNTLMVNGHTCEEESSNRGADGTATTNQRRPHSEVREQSKQKKGAKYEMYLGQLPSVL